MDLTERGPSQARHPWEIERLRAYRSVLARHGALAARRVLDVGAGDGWFSQELLAALRCDVEVVCWDINYTQPELASDDPRLTRTAEPPPPGFDLVLALDVLEHVDDPRRMIDEQLRPLAAARTPVLVAVPANPRLYGEHDRALGHVRRYRPADLHAELQPWLDIVETGSLFSVLVPARAIAVAGERRQAAEASTGVRGAARQHGVGAWSHGAIVTTAVRSLLATDTALHRFAGPLGRRLPGLSTWVFGRVR